MDGLQLPPAPAPQCTPPTPLPSSSLITGILPPSSSSWPVPLLGSPPHHPLAIFAAADLRISGPVPIFFTSGAPRAQKPCQLACWPAHGHEVMHAGCVQMPYCLKYGLASPIVTITQSQWTVGGRASVRVSCAMLCLLCVACSSLQWKTARDAPQRGPIIDPDIGQRRDIEALPRRPEPQRGLAQGNTLRIVPYRGVEFRTRLRIALSTTSLLVRLGGPFRVGGHGLPVRRQVPLQQRAGSSFSRDSRSSIQSPSGPTACPTLAKGKRPMPWPRSGGGVPRIRGTAASPDAMRCDTMRSMKGSRQPNSLQAEQQPPLSVVRLHSGPPKIWPAHLHFPTKLRDQSREMRHHRQHMYIMAFPVKPTQTRHCIGAAPLREMNWIQQHVTSLDPISCCALLAYGDL